MPNLHWIAHGVVLAELMLRLSLSVRVIMRRLPVGVSLAWLAIILIFPFGGAVVYLLIGEYRLGPGRGRRAVSYRKNLGTQLPEIETANQVDPATLGPEAGSLARLAAATLGGIPLSGNQLELLPNADAAFPVLIGDIDQARQTCFLEFYIWSSGGKADEVGAALSRAAQRGVACRVLVDAIGSGAFLRSTQASDLRKSGVRVEAALRSGLLRVLFVRPDLRMHRKVVLIDGQAGYTGSMNLADPRLFKQNAGVGQWVDALARVQGPALRGLAATFREDWFLETGELIERMGPSGEPMPHPSSGKAVIQVLPSGPDANVEAIEQVELMAIYCAKQEIVLTTPYFVPGESLLTALLSAASRGVQVTLIVPAKIDSRLVHFASRAFQKDLLQAGVRVALYQDGLLHTKSITVDGAFSLFGSVNLDPRSFRLDLEITLAVYDAEFTAALWQLQQLYLDRSALLDLSTCAARSRLERLAENAARLVGPLL